MSIVVQCGECGRRYAASDQSAGRQLKCKACGNMIAVPAPRSPYVDDAYSAPVHVAPPALPSRAAAPAYAPAITRAPADIGQRLSRRRDENQATVSDRFARVLLIVTGIAFLLSIVLFVIGLSTGSRSTLILMMVIWVPIIIVNGLWTLHLVAQESAICVILALFVPFYSLYYILTRWETMSRPFLIHVCAVICIVGTAKAMAPPENDNRQANSDRRPFAQDDFDSEEEESFSEPAQSSNESRPRRPRGSFPPAEPARPQVSQEQQRLDNIVSQIEAFAARDWRSSSREQAMAELATLQATVDAEKRQVDDRVGGASLAWSRVNSEMSTLRSRLGALPSEAPDPSIFQEPTANATAWTPRRPDVLGDEVTYHAFRIRPPAHALLDLNSTENAEQGFVWASASTGGTMTIKQTPKTNPKQKQPLTVGHSQGLDRANRDQLLAFDTRQSVVSNGTISGMRFWRVQPKPGSGGPIRYYATAGNDWLTIEILLTDSTPSPTVVDTFDDAVRSIQPQKPGEPKADPFAPERIAKRLSDQPDKALQLLWPHQSSVERLVTPFLTSTNLPTARAAAKFLGEFGTKASLVELRTAAEATDTDIANGARTALRRLIPDEFDMASELLLDLKGKEPSRRAEALTKIVAVQPTPARRAAVAAALEDLMLAESGDVDRALVAQALSAWYSDKTAARLLPLLSKEDTEEAKRNAAIDVIAATGDKAGAATIVRWLLKAPEKATAALIKMGPVAEEPVYKLYNTISTSRDANHVAVRANCVRVLSEIGCTFPSQQVLVRASKDPRDPGTQEAAKLGIEAVKGRIAAPKTAPKSTTKPV